MPKYTNTLAVKEKAKRVGNNDLGESTISTEQMEKIVKWYADYAKRYKIKPTKVSSMVVRE